MSKFVSVPTEIEAIQISEGHFDEIRELTGTFKDQDEERFVFLLGHSGYLLYVDEIDSITPVQVGDWVVKSETGFVAYTDDYFRESFRPMDEEADDTLEENAPPTVETDGEFDAVLADATLREELTELFTKNKRPSQSGTHDYVLANFLMGSLENFEESIKMRAGSRLERWEFDADINTDKE